MEILGIKRLSYGATLAAVVILILLIAGAMFFADKVDGFIDNWNTKTTQAMEMRGSWLGMRLASLDSATAQRLGIPASAKGVLIAEIEERNGWRVRQAGAMEGDVIVAVAGQDVRNLSDMYDVSRNVDVAGVVTMDIRRWGQVMTLVLPALQAQPAMIQGANAAGAQPVAWIQGPQGAQFYCPRITGTNATAMQPVAWPSQQAMPGAQFCCPFHNRVWSQNEVYPQFRCPICNCPLNRVR